MEKRITGHTELIGLMAYPIRHSSSPAMHNAAFAKLGLDYAYLAFEVDNDSLEGAVQGIRSLKLVGSNVSMPNKTVVHKYLDKLSPAAEMCGAVNTIVNEDGVLTGHITDGTGYMMSLKDNGVDVMTSQVPIMTLCDIIYTFIPTGAGEDEIEKGFFEAVEFAKKILYKITKKFVDSYENYRMIKNELKKQNVKESHILVFEKSVP